MQLTSEQRILWLEIIISDHKISLLTSNYLKTRSFKEVQQPFEQHFWNRVSLTKITIRKNVKKYKTEGPSLNITKIAQVAEEQNIHRKTLISFKKSLSRIQEYQLKRMVWTLVRIQLTESLRAIWNEILIRCMLENNYKSSWFTEKKSEFTYGRNAKNDASLSSKKSMTCRRKQKLATYMNIQCFRIKYWNYDLIFLLLTSTRWSWIYIFNFDSVFPLLVQARFWFLYVLITLQLWVVLLAFYSYFCREFMKWCLSILNMHYNHFSK